VKLVMLGGAGAGKGTQAKQLSTHLKIPQIATGDIFRDAIAKNTELGQKAQAYVDQGELVPDEITIEFMRQRLQQPDTVDGWVLDGYPRTAFQAEELDFLLEKLGQRLRWAIWLDVPESILIERSLARSRDDDQLAIVLRRIQLFQERTIPILEYYEPRNRLLRINGNQSPEQVQQDILQKLNNP
jgi:adenylate kinase